MLETLVILCSLIWLPVLLHQIHQRGLVVFLIWIFVAPVAVNVVKAPGTNPFFTAPTQQQDGPKRRGEKGLGYLEDEVTIRMSDVLQPTRLLFGLFIVVFMATSILQRKKPITLDRTETLMVVFILVVVTSALLQSKRPGFGLRVATDAFTVPFLGYFIARRLVMNEDHLMKLSQVIGYMGVYLIIIGLIERLMYTNLTYRLRGPFDFRDAFYITIMVVFFVVLVEAIGAATGGHKRPLPKAMQIFVLSCAPIIILFVWTRGPWIGFLFGIWTFALLGSKLIMARRKILIAGLVLSLFPIAFMGLQEALSVEDVVGRVGRTGNIYGRLATYQIMVEEWSRKPLFGIGLNNVRDLLAEREISLYGVRSFRFSHNSYLSLATEVGVIGFLAYLAIVASILGMGLRVFRMGKHTRDRWRGIGVIAIMVAYLIPPLSDSTLYRTWVSHVYVFVFAGAVSGVYQMRRALHRIQPEDAASKSISGHAHGRAEGEPAHASVRSRMI